MAIDDRNRGEECAGGEDHSSTIRWKGKLKANPETGAIRRRLGTLYLSNAAQDDRPDFGGTLRLSMPNAEFRLFGYPDVYAARDNWLQDLLDATSQTEQDEPLRFNKAKWFNRLHRTTACIILEARDMLKAYHESKTAADPEVYKDAVDSMLATLLDWEEAKKPDVPEACPSTSDSESSQVIRKSSASYSGRPTTAPPRFYVGDYVRWACHDGKYEILDIRFSYEEGVTLLLRGPKPGSPADLCRIEVSAEEVIGWSESDVTG